MKRHDERRAEHALEERRIQEAGGRARLERQKKLGRWSARERIVALLDPGTFSELGRHVRHRRGDAAARPPGDGLVCGTGRVTGQLVAVYAHDPTVQRGALGHAASQKLCRLLDLALEQALPVVAFNDSDGVRIDEGSDAVLAYGEVMRRVIQLRRRALQISVVSGLCVGAAAYCTALTDLCVMVSGQSFMFITGPKVTQIVTGEEVAIEALGGGEMHATKTGSAHALVQDEREAIVWVKRALDVLIPSVPCADDMARDVPEIERIVPAEPRRAYDMRKVLAALFDAGSLFELSPRFVGSLLTVFGRLGGRRVAVLASQPMVRAGCLDVASSRKGAHFIRLANRLRVPIVTLVDVPGYVPGLKQEEGGIIAFGSELLAAYGECTVPLLSLVVRKSFGGANILSFAAQVRLALTTAQVAPMGADAAREVFLGPLAPDAAPELRARHEAFIADWRAQYEHVWRPAEDGYFDRVVLPEAARRELWLALESVSRVGTS